MVLRRLKNIRLLRCVWLAALLLLSYSTLAQMYEFRSFDIRHGLRSSEVNCMLQDSQGYLWVGTERGVYRFNGQDFVTTTEKPELPHHVVRALAEVDGQILVGTDKGLARLNGLDVKVDTNFTNESIKRFIEYEGKTYIISTNAIFEYGSPFPEQAFDKERIKDALVHDGALWLGTESNGILRLEKVEDHWALTRFDNQTDPSTPMKVQGMALGLDDQLWIASIDKGISYYDGSTFNEVSFEEDKNYIYSSIAYDPTKRSFWCGTWGNGLVNINTGMIRTYDEENGLPDNTIKSVFLTEEGLIFCGTMTQGLCQFVSDKTIIFNKKSGLGDNNVRSIVSAGDRTYVATLKGLSVYNGTEMQQMDGPLGTERSGTMAVLNDSTIYVGTYMGNLYRVVHRDGVELTDKIAAVDAEILSIYIHDDVVYLGTYRGGAYAYNGELRHLETGEDASTIWSLAVNDHRIYMGTEDGIYFINRKTNKVEPFAPQEPGLWNTRINQLGFEKGPHALLAATEDKGIWLYDSLEADHYMELSAKKDGLHSDVVRGFTYRKKTLVLSSGIKIQSVVFSDNGKDENIKTLFDVTDFGHKEINPGSIVNANDAIWIGTGYGVVSFTYDETGARDRATKPICLLESVVVGERPFEPEQTLTKGLQLNYDQNDFEFRLSSINLNCVATEYWYKMDGVDGKWRTANQPIIQYHNLHPGEYTFRYKTVDIYGNESEEYTVKIVIDNPYWRNWRFLSIVLFGILISFTIILYIFRPRDKVIGKRNSLVQNLATSRLILTFGGVLYPTVGYMDALVDDRIVNPQLEVSIVIGATLVFCVIASLFYRMMQDVLHYIVLVGYLTIFSHLSIILYMNNLVPTHVIGAILVISVSSIIFNRYRDLLIFALYVAGVVLWISFNVVEPYYTASQFIVASVASLLISLLLIAVRLNLYSRLELSASVLNNIDSLVMVADEEGNVTFVSESITKLLGYRRRDVLGQKWWGATGQRTDREYIKEVMAQKRTNVENSYVTDERHKDGSTRIFRWIDSYLDDGLIVGVGHDITEIYGMEQEMERLSIVARETSSGVIIMDSDNRLQWANYAFLKMTGYELEDLLHKRPADILKGPGTDMDVVEQSRSEQGKESAYRFEILVYRKDGTPLWLDVANNPVKDQSGSVNQIVEVITDISDQKGAEQQLKQLSLVASKTDNYVIISDHEDKVIWVNQSFERIFGFELDEIKGLKIASFLSTETLSPVVTQEIRKTVFDEKKNYVGEFCDKTKNGDIIWVSTNVTPVLNVSGEIDYIISLGTNITERKLSEFQIQQFARSNALMHGIDSILIKEHSADTIPGEISKLIMQSNTDFFLSAFFEVDMAVGKTTVTYCGKDLEPVVEVHDITEYTSLEYMLQGKAFMVDNVMDLDNLSRTDKWLMFHGVRSYLMVPIIIEDELRGMIGSGANRPMYYDENEIETFSSIADSIAVVFKQQEQSDLIAISEENFRQLNESISESFWLSDRIEKQLIYVNSTFERMFEITAEELYDDPTQWIRNVHPDDKDWVRKAFAQKADSGDFDEEYRILTSSGEVRWIHSTVYPILDDDNCVIRLSGSSRDITAQRQSEQAVRELNRQLTSINTLNTAILNDKEIDHELYEIVKTLFEGQKILRLNILLYDFDRNLARYHFLREEITQLDYPEEFSLSNISKDNLKQLQQGEYVLVPDVQARKERKSPSDGIQMESGINAYMMYPLIHNNVLLGSMNISFPERFELDMRKAEFMQLVAKGISISIYQKILQDRIETDRMQLEDINRNLSDSISYAKRFQDARLPDISELKKWFKGADVLYIPKDVVGGDFYWFGQVDDHLVFTSADCTGHGVPGGFMTMLFNSLLDKTANDKRLVEPHIILQELHSGVRDYFRADRSAEISDGMDIVMCSYNTVSDELQFSGARRPLIIYKQSTGKVKFIEGAIYSIGEKETPKKAFESQVVSIEKGDTIYLMSDGFTDQFGGPEARKFGKQRLIALIKELGAKTPLQQKKGFAKALKDWRGEEEQIDDILLMIVKI